MNNFNEAVGGLDNPNDTLNSSERHRVNMRNFYTRTETYTEITSPYSQNQIDTIQEQVLSLRFCSAPIIDFLQLPDQSSQTTKLVEMFGVPQYLTLQNPEKCLIYVDEEIAALKDNAEKFVVTVNNSLLIQDEQRELLIDNYRDYLKRLEQDKSSYIIEGVT